MSDYKQNGDSSVWMAGQWAEILNASLVCELAIRSICRRCLDKGGKMFYIVHTSDAD